MLGAQGRHSSPKLAWHCPRHGARPFQALFTPQHPPALLTPAGFAIGKASKWVEYLTLNDSGSLAALDEFKKAFLERFDKTQSVLEAQCLISNLRQSSDEDVQDFFE